ASGYLPCWYSSTTCRLRTSSCCWGSGLAISCRPPCFPPSPGPGRTTPSGVGDLAWRWGTRCLIAGNGHPSKRTGRAGVGQPGRVAGEALAHAHTSPPNCLADTALALPNGRVKGFSKGQGSLVADGPEGADESPTPQPEQLRRPGAQAGQ